MSITTRFFEKFLTDSTKKDAILTVGVSEDSSFIILKAMTTADADTADADKEVLEELSSALKSCCTPTEARGINVFKMAPPLGESGLGYQPDRSVIMINRQALEALCAKKGFLNASSIMTELKDKRAIFNDVKDCELHPINLNQRSKSIDGETFKTAYLEQYKNEWFKNPWSKMKLQLDEITDPNEIMDFAKKHHQQNKNSRTFKVLHKLAMKR